MNALGFIYRRLGGFRARQTYVKWASLVCRLLLIESFRAIVGGVPIYISSQDNWGLRNYYFTGSYNPDSIEMLKDILVSRSDSVFWDIGANYGAYSLLLHPYAAHTIAVEPSSRTFRHLRRSCNETQANVILENCAVGGKSGEGLLYLSPNHFGDHRTYRPQEEQRKTETVRLSTIDDIARTHFQSLPSNNVMKIDTQGAETSVLRGARHVICNSNVVFILLEVWPKGLLDAGSSLQELIDVCDTYGLSPVDKSGEAYKWDSILSKFTNDDQAISQLDVLLARCT